MIPPSAGLFRQDLQDVQDKLKIRRKNLLYHVNPVKEVFILLLV